MVAWLRGAFGDTPLAATRWDQSPPHQPPKAHLPQQRSATRVCAFSATGLEHHPYGHSQTNPEATVRGSRQRWGPSRKSPGSCHPGHGPLAHRGRAQLLPRGPSCGEAALD